MELEKEVVYYILSRKNDIHPFRLSRLLLLFEIEYSKKYGEKPLEFVYRLQPAAFYIEDFGNFLESLDGVSKVKVTDENGIPVKGFIHLEKPVKTNIPDHVRRLLDRILEETDSLDDQELNRLIVNSEDYRSLYEEFGE